MPSWSARLLPASSAVPSSTSSGSSPRQQQQGPVTHQPSVYSHTDPTVPPLPISIGTTGSGSRGQRSGHGRSISNPFPSLFKSGKREEGDGAAESNTTTREPEDGVRAEPGSGPGPSIQIKNADLVTGRCMTCDTLVRWPQGLKTFRCTICLMINDLTTVTLTTSSSKSAPATTFPLPKQSAGLPQARGALLLPESVKRG